MCEEKGKLLVNTYVSEGPPKIFDTIYLFIDKILDTLIDMHEMRYPVLDV